MGRARLECDIERRSFGGEGSSLSIAQGFDLGMWFAGCSMPAAANDCPGFYEHRAYHRVGRCFSIASPSEAQGETHVIFRSRLASDHWATLEAWALKFKIKRQDRVRVF